MACFYLAALLALTHTPWSRRALAATVLFAALALGSKEMAATLPVAALAVVLAYGRDWRPRLFAVAAVGALTGVFVLWWMRLFPSKAHLKLEQVVSLPRLLIPVFAPTAYERWWNEDPGGWILLVALLLAIAGLAGVAWKRGDTGRARLIALALSWPLFTMIPVFGLRPPDVYRLGFLICFAFALLVAAVAALFEARRWLPLAMAAVIAVWYVPLARSSVAVWGPGGFQYSLIIRWNQQVEGWDGQLSPEMRQVFRKQMRRHPP
jgi:hypothetical protein